MTEIGVIKGQDLEDPVLDHQGDEAHIVTPLALDRVFGNQAFPGGITVHPWWITPWLSIQPDLRYIIHPGLFV